MGISDDDYAKAIEKMKSALLPSQQTIGLKPLREEDLKHEAMQAPLSSLADMWLARWGSQWVAEQEFMDDDFWRLTLIRLVGANKLEKHTFVNQYHCVYRIIE
jgi:ABC-type oligopeptide transport system substrate-binding subunit